MEGIDMNGYEAIEDLVRAKRNELEKRKERLCQEEEEQNVLETVMEQLSDLLEEKERLEKQVAERDQTIDRQALQLEKQAAEQAAVKKENTALKDKCTEGAYVLPAQGQEICRTCQADGRIQQWDGRIGDFLPTKMIHLATY